MSNPTQLINLIKLFYDQPELRVAMEGRTFQREGHPLSPSLFIIGMTVLFNDIHHDSRFSMEGQRIAGSIFDEVRYADDTICIPQKTAEMNSLHAAFENAGHSMDQT